MSVNPCCDTEEKRKANCIVIEWRELKDDAGNSGGFFVTYQCQTCQRNHYVHEVAPIVWGVEGAPM